MYNPRAFAVDDAPAVLAALRHVGFGHLVTATAAGIEATAIPFLVDDDLTSVSAHLARANGHWRSMQGASALMIVGGADGYVSPRWYPSKADDSAVVPTWNYELVHLHGTIEVHDDGAWTQQLVGRLTERHERRTDATTGGTPWSLDDAPAEFIARQVRAIVGVELIVERVEAKRKLSQNRSDVDRAGVIEALTGSPDADQRHLGAAMDRPPH